MIYDLTAFDPGFKPALSRSSYFKDKVDFVIALVGTTLPILSYDFAWCSFEAPIGALIAPNEDYLFKLKLQVDPLLQHLGPIYGFLSSNNDSFVGDLDLFKLNALMAILSCFGEYFTYDFLF